MAVLPLRSELSEHRRDDGDAAKLEGHPEARLELIDSFERDFLVPGLDPDRLATVWTQHREHGRTELHFIIANVDLETQKRFPAYFDRADRTRLATWQDFKNLSRGLDDPRAPERQRAVSHDLKLPMIDMERAQLAEELEKLVAEKCMRGELEDRNAIVQFIESNDLKVGRQGKELHHCHLRGCCTDRLRPPDFTGSSASVVYPDLSKTSSRDQRRRERFAVDA
jgi:hypothetical protein